MKSVKLEWCLEDLDNALTLLEEAIVRYEDFAKVG